MATPTAYLDGAATTRMRPEVAEVMASVSSRFFANPSGGHALARSARRVIDDARDVIAEALGAEPGEVIFTAGGTEADNQAIRGIVERRGGTAVCSAVEHHAVLECVEHFGGRIVGVDAQGIVDLEELSGSLDEAVSVVSAMLVNNETGVIEPLSEIAEIVRREAPNAVLHSDVVQAFPWIDVSALGGVADLLAISAHKFGGPMGVGALVVRDGVDVAPLIWGGGQEKGLRSGTHNTAGIAGMAEAARLAVITRGETVEQVSGLRDRLLQGLTSHVDGLETTVTDAPTVAGACHICIDGVESEALLFLLEEHGVSAAAGSSCSSGAVQMSHVLAAMGTPGDRARGALRLSLSYDTDATEIDHCLRVLPPLVDQLRRAAP